MTWFRAATDLVEVVAWPGVVLALALVYRRPLSQLVLRVRRLTGGGIAIEIDELAESALQESRRVADEPTEEPPGDLEHYLQSVLEHDAIGSFLGSWALFERAVAERAASEGVALDSGTRRLVRAIMEELARAGHVSADAMRTFEALYGIRNRLAHGIEFEISASSLAEMHLALARLTRVVKGQGSSSS